MFDKTFLIWLFIIFLGNTGVAQRQPAHNLDVSINTVGQLLNGEAGLYIVYRINRLMLAEIFAGKVLNGFNIVAWGGSGSGYKYWPTNGYAASGGVLFALSGDSVMKNFYFFRSLFKFKKLNTPTYCTRHGPNGLNSILRETISEEKEVYKFFLHVGGRQVKGRFFYEYFMGVGVGINYLKTTLYGWGWSGSCFTESYPPGKKEEDILVYPAFDSGIKVGYVLY